MKFKLLLLIACLSIGFSNAQTKVGTVDSEYIAALMPEREIIMKRAQLYGAKLDSSFNNKMKEYNVKLELFKNTSKTAVDSIKQKEYRNLIAMEQDLKQYRDNGVKLMQIKQNELMRPLNKKLGETIQAVAKENGYTQILTLTGNEFAYIDPLFDITKLVMDKLGIKPPAPEKK